jgi:hypothetical protein
MKLPYLDWGPQICTTQVPIWRYVDLDSVPCLPSSTLSANFEVPILPDPNMRWSLWGPWLRSWYIQILTWSSWGVDSGRNKNLNFTMKLLGSGLRSQKAHPRSQFGDMGIWILFITQPTTLHTDQIFPKI